MTELKPCPFCGGEVTHEEMMDGSYSFLCNTCGLNARWPDDLYRAVPEAIKRTEELWNTRYERTCTASAAYNSMLGGYDIRLSCGHDYFSEEPDDIVSYCPYCGAKVVSNDQAV